MGVNRKNLLWFVASTTVYRVGCSTWFCFSLVDWGMPLCRTHHSIPHCWLLGTGFASPASQGSLTSEGVCRGLARVLLHPIPLRAEKVKIKKGTGHWSTQSRARPLQMEAKAAPWLCFSSLAISSEGELLSTGTIPHSIIDLLSKTLSPFPLTMHSLSIFSLQYKQPLHLKRHSRLNCLRHKQERNYLNQLVSVVKGGEGWSQVF